MGRIYTAQKIASSSAFGDPRDVATLAAWYRADIGITIATGVSQWSDLSGNARHLLQATGSLQPSFIASAVNGRPGVRLDGVDDYLEATFTLAQPVTIFFVYKSIVVGAAGGHDIVYSGPSNNVTYQSDTTPRVLLSAGGGAPPTYAASVANGSYEIVTGVVNGASSFIRVRGAQVASGDTGAAALGGFRLGYVAAARTANVEVAELAVYSSALGSAPIGAIESYMRTRYAL